MRLSCCSSALARGGDGSLEVRVAEVDVWDERAQEHLGALEPRLQRFYILWCRITAAVRRLVECAFCRMLA